MYKITMTVFWAMLVWFLVVGRRVHTAGIDQNGSIHSSEDADQPYRTAYHFQPPNNWMNDPNAPLYYKGVYHLFYQYNPYSAIWGNMTWGHAISYDLINWFNLEYTLNPSESYDLGGCYTGSATILPGGKPVIIYTGAASQLYQDFQSQNLAFPKDPNDPLLRQWVKSPYNPVISATDGDINPTNFRDPTTAWQNQDGIWHVLIGAKIDGLGMVLMYKSKDFVNWTRSEKPFHSSVRTGMLECPDFFPVNISGKSGVENYLDQENTKFVLKASFLEHDHYVLGHYNAETSEFKVEEGDYMEGDIDLRFDYGGKFYASKSFYDGGEKRRVLWAWLPEACTRNDDIEKGWSGVQSIPRTLWLSPNAKQLMQWPVHETENLRKEKVEIQGKNLKGGSLIEIVGISGAQADVEVSFELPSLEEVEQMDPTWVDPQLLCIQKNAAVEGTIGPFGLLVLASKNLTEQTAIYFRVFRDDDKHVVLMCTDLSRSSLRNEVDKTSFGAFVDINPLQEKISLRTLIDHSVVESFGGGGKACITARVYPNLAVNKEARLYAFNNGSVSLEISHLNAWSMKEANIVPLSRRRKPPTSN